MIASFGKGMRFADPGRCRYRGSGRTSVLGPIAGRSATMNLFCQMLSAVYILYVTIELQLPPVWISIIFDIGSLAALAGAMLPSRLAE